jgi:hypothetical protein
LVIWFFDLTILKGGLSLIPILGTVAICGALAGHVFGAADAVQSLFQANDSVALTKAILDLISKLADIGVHVMLLIPVVNLPGVIALGIVAKGAGLIGFLVVHFNEDSTQTQGVKK